MSKAKKEAPKPALPIKSAPGAKKVGPELSRRDKIDLLSARINKDFAGKGAIQHGDGFSNVFTLRRPTGLMDLDLALAGGFPAGGLSQIIGEDGAGKSYLTNRVISNVQQIYGDEAAISVCMTEMIYDKAFAKWRCGVKVAYSDQEIRDLQQANTERGLPAFTAEEIKWLKEEVGTFQQSIFATAEQVLESAVQQIESNLYQVVLIDSFGALLTEAEAEAEDGLEAKQYAGASGVITKFMHRLHAALNLPDSNGRPNTTTVLGINQYRENLKATGKFDNPIQIAGGRALKHGKLVDLLLEKGSNIWVGPKTNLVKVGREVKWNIIKGKAGCHDGPKGTYKFYLGKPDGFGQPYPFGADIYSSLLESAKNCGVVELSGSWYSFNNERLGQGESNAVATLAASPPFMDAIRQGIFQKMGIRFITKESY